MDPVANICRKFAVIPFPLLAFGLIELLSLFVWIFLAWKVIHPKKQKSTKIILGVSFGIGFLPIALLIFIAFVISATRWGEPPSQKYAVLNAAVKNTCYLDPQRNHCPKNLDELIAIEPEHFNPIAQSAQITYQYYPQTNTYTLVVRDKSFSISNLNVALFDPRIKFLQPSPENAWVYFNGTYDFGEPQYAFCFGKNIIVNPPPFPGPWDNI